MLPTVKTHKLLCYNFRVCSPNTIFAKTCSYQWKSSSYYHLLKVFFCLTDLFDDCMTLLCLCYC